MRFWIVLWAVVGGAGCSGDSVDDSVLPDVVINEFLASNATGLTDATGAFPDWVELFNRSDVPVDLAGFTLTDDLSFPTKWVFPAGTQIAAGGYLIVFCDGDVADGPLHASFSLSAQGESIGLYAPPARGSAPLDELDFDAQVTDVSSARIPNGGDTWQPASPPTPGAPN